MEKEPYSRESYEATKKQSKEPNKTSREKSAAFGKMADMEGQANDEAKEFDTRFTKARENERSAKKEMDDIRAELGVSPESKDDDKVLIDRLREKLVMSPEEELKIITPKIGGKNRDEIVREAKEQGVIIGSYAQSRLDSKEFTTSKEAKEALLAEITGANLGLADGYTTKQFFDRMDEVGLFKCTDEVGPDLRLQDSGKEYRIMAMEPFAVSHGHLDVFNLYSDDGQLKLNTYRAKPGNEWDADYPWVVSLRKLES